jgi:MoxR-like ATPase
MSKVFAAIQGRTFVTPDDVKLLAPFVLSHRIIIKDVSAIRGGTGEDLVRSVLESTPAPVEDFKDSGKAATGRG